MGHREEGESDERNNSTLIVLMQSCMLKIFLFELICVMEIIGNMDLFGKCFTYMLGKIKCNGR